MKLWKILLATMIAMLLVCAVAMADTCEDGCNIAVNFTTIEAATCTETGLKAQRKCTETDCDNYDVFVNPVVVPATGHAWNETSSKYEAPTCTKTGARYYKCDNCESTKTETVAKLDHPTTIVVVKAATCSENGVQVVNCNNNCGYSETKVVPATGKCNWVNQNGLAATCDKAGYTTYAECSMCKAIRGKEVIPATGNHNVKSVAKVDATCVADGCTAYSACWDCDWTEGKAVIPAHGNHNWVRTAALCVHATCDEAGYDVFVCHAGCGEQKKVELPALGHKWEFYKEVAPTCTDDGYIRNECSVCHERVSVASGKVATGHNFSVKISEAKVTCTTDGYVEYACANNCGNSEKRDVVAKTGHNHETLIENYPATCTQDGYEAYKCACGDIKYVTVAQLEHNYSSERWTVKVAPNCLSAGTESNVCTMCGKAEIIRVVPATGHKLGSGIVEKEATCTEDGLRVKGCVNDDCEYQESVVVKALGHNPVDRNVTEADCTKVGMKQVFCSVCDEHLEKNVIIPATGHKGEVTNYVAPTCTAEGTKTTKCENCNKTVTETLDKVAHAYEWKTTPATPSANGKSEYKCNVCGDVKETKTIKYSKWYYNNTMTSFGPMTRELVGGNDWERVTPVDLTVDGVYTYDLIASNKYIVGTATITVNAGTLTVSYSTKGNVDVKDEALLIYASKADLATGTAVTAPVGAAINAAETFGADTKVLVSLILTGDYDAAGKGLVDASAAAGMIANID